MRRLVQATVVLWGVLAVPGATAQPTMPRSAALDHFACRRAAQPRRRAISVQAVMRHRPGTRRMALRFVLLWRAPGRRSASSEHGGDLGRWQHPTDPPTLGQRRDDVWRVTETVRNLADGGSYRFRVDFRWTGKGGRTLYETTLLSPRCREG